jgi:hypothetical protein
MNLDINTFEAERKAYRERSKLSVAACSKTRRRNRYVAKTKNISAI